MPAATTMAATPASDGPSVFFLPEVDAMAHILVALAVAVAGFLLFRRCGLSGGRLTAQSRHGGSQSRCCYMVTVCTTCALAAVEVVLAAYLCYLDGAAGWPRDVVADLVDAAARAVAWTLLAAYLKLESGVRPFPTLLMLWWLLFLVLSVLSVAVHVPVPAGRTLAVDGVSVIAAVVLLTAGLLGRREAGSDSAAAAAAAAASSEEEVPLLNRSSSGGAGAQQASMFTGAGFLSELSFSWIGPLLAVGRRKTIDLDDVPGLDPGDSVNGLLPVFKDKLKAFSAGDDTVTAFGLSMALLRTVWWHVAVTALYALVYNVATYVGPYLIDSLVQHLRGGGGDKNKQGGAHYIVLAFIAAKVVECLSQRHWFFRLQQAGIRAHAALVAVVYEKGLALSSRSRQSRTSGEMVNLISVDADRVRHFAWDMHDLWLVPLQVSMALFILNSTLGVAGALAALGATVVIMLGNIPPGRMQKKFQQKLMHCKDVRMKATSEILRSMRILRLQAWEMKFLSKITELRKTETDWLKNYLYTSAMSTFVFWGAPTFVAVVTFGACMCLGIPLESGKVLSALATFRVLQEPIYKLPSKIAVLIQTKVSLDRIGCFLCLEESPTDAVERLPSGSSGVAICISDGCFSWSSEASPEVLTLRDLNFHVRQGMRVAVCGMVGSGKSSLLSCILGEIPKVSGEVKTCGTMAYVSQSAWIQSSTIQKNILFGKEMNPDKYERVLESCSLKKDLGMLPLGDQTVVGERGINLSGGQKQRIQVARALYQDADIYLLDDPFSALDAHTGSHLFKECLLGALASKTVVYVTHQIGFLPKAELILVMKDGRIAQAGKYHELRLDSGGQFMELIGAHKDALTALDVTDVANGGEEASSSGRTEKLPWSPKSAEKKEGEDDNGNAQSGQLVQEEEREKGRVGFLIYWKYLTTAYKGAFVPLVLLAQILFEVLQIASNYWMARTAPISMDVEPPLSMSTMIGVYVALALGSSVFVLIRSLFLVTAAYKTATLLFNKMHWSIFRAPMSFYDSTPSGRILNRVSTDQSQVDTSIADQMGLVAFTVIQLVGIVAVMSQVAWKVFIVFIPVLAASFWYQRYYIDTARELQRLVGVCKAPIIQHFAESIAGSTTITSFSKQNQFVLANNQLIDAYSRLRFYNAAAMEWLCFRLDVLSSLTFAFCVIFLISLPPGLIDPGVAGLAVTYGLNLNTLQAWVVWNMCNLENKIISVERILQYISIPEEPPLSTSDDRLALNWPSEGEIQLHDLHVRYAPQLPCVLKGLTVTFPGGLKTSIVGRTGSGKSTLIQALFRIMDPTVGQIMIDGIDICTIGLHDLRSRLSIIPQEPTMFEGTVRSNLDPLGDYTDSQIWEALDCCQLGDEVRNKERKLDSPVIENGENWSVGQRQLVCLGRVILKRRKILVLDEATASVDTATDNLIQKTLQQQFSEVTVLTIAHRITSVLNGDMVLLLDNGVVVEHDAPGKLLKDDSSLFSKLVAEFRLNHL